MKVTLLVIFSSLFPHWVAVVMVCRVGICNFLHCVMFVCNVSLHDNSRIIILRRP
jgi:hypothetical protein